MKRLVRAPFAITSDGDILVNLLEFRDAPAGERIARELAGLDAAVFIGVRIRGREIDVVVDRIDNAIAEAVGRLVGQRRRRPVTRSRRTTRS